MFGYSYFFEIIKKDDKVLPKDVRTIQIDVKKKDIIAINELISLVDKCFLNEIEDTSFKKQILDDVFAIVKAIIHNESENTIILFDISRFSLVFKIANKMLKVGFPKIVYEIPHINIIIESIIRKQYFDSSNGVPVLFVEVQEYKDNNLKTKYSNNEIEEIIYQLWKSLRLNEIVWYDPKDKNIVINNFTLSNWNSIYYEKSNNTEKGIYNLQNDNLENNFKDFLIVDTDLFLPISVLKKLNILYKEHPEWPGFSNWKFKKIMNYEKRFEMERNKL